MPGVRGLGIVEEQKRRRGALADEAADHAEGVVGDHKGRASSLRSFVHRRWHLSQVVRATKGIDNLEMLVARQVGDEKATTHRHHNLRPITVHRRVVDPAMGAAEGDRVVVEVVVAEVVVVEVAAREDRDKIVSKKHLRGKQ